MAGVLFVIGEKRLDGRRARQGAVERIESVKAVFGTARRAIDLGFGFNFGHRSRNRLGGTAVRGERRCATVHHGVFGCRLRLCDGTGSRTCAARRRWFICGRGTDHVWGSSGYRVSQ